MIKNKEHEISHGRGNSFRHTVIKGLGRARIKNELNSEFLLYAGMHKILLKLSSYV